MNYHRYCLLPLLTASILFTACQKDSPSPLPPPAPLKIVKKVVSSADRFIAYEYDARGNVSRYTSHWQDAAGNRVTQVNTLAYKPGGQLEKWINSAGHGLFIYQNGRLKRSEHFAANGKKISEMGFGFDRSGKLMAIIETIVNPVPAGPMQTKITYEYYSNGNISRIKFGHRNEPTGAFSVYFSKRFVQYDNKKNPEPDGVLGVFVPGVILQYNNPVLVENIMADGKVQGYSRYEYAYNGQSFPTQRKQFIAINNVEEATLRFTYHY